MKTFPLTALILMCIAIPVISNAQEIIYEFPKSVTEKIQEHISHYADTSKFIALLLCAGG